MRVSARVTGEADPDLALGPAYESEFPHVLKKRRSVKHTTMSIEMSLHIENARALTSHVVEKHESIRNALLSVVISLPPPSSRPSIDTCGWGRGAVAACWRCWRNTASRRYRSRSGSSWCRSTCVLILPRDDVAVDSSCHPVSKATLFFDDVVLGVSSLVYLLV